MITTHTSSSQAHFKSTRAMIAFLPLPVCYASLQITMSSLLKSFRSSGQATWVDDDDVDSCSVCTKRIVAGLLSSNKHHCRQCGLVVCAACSKQKINNERTCDACFEQIQRAQKCEKFFIPFLKKGAVFQKYPGSAGAARPGAG